MIGSLRERIEILKPERVPDGGGGFEIAYSSLGEIAARADSRSAARDRSLDRDALRRRRRFVIRRRDDLVFEMRLLHRGRHYRITDIQDEDERGRLTMVQGEEVPQ